MAKLALQGSNVFSYTFGINGAQDNYIYASNTRNNSVLNVGGESWTIEFWAKTANAIYSTEQALFALRAPGTVTTSIYGFLRVANSGAITFYNGTSYNSNYILPPNVWTHIAYVFNQGANTRIFVNGSNVMTTTAVTSITNIDAPFYIGGLGGFSYQYFGEISNFRMIRGQAVYSGESFNVSTFPMQLPNNSIGPHATGANVASSLTGNVVLLTCNDQYLKTNGNSVINGFSTLGTVSYHSIDTKELQNFSYYYPGNTGPGQNGTVLVTSTTNSLNLNGDFTIETWYYPVNSSPFPPSSNGSVSFSGTQYLQVTSTNAFAFGTGNFTIEAWIYTSAPRGGGVTNDKLIFGAFSLTPAMVFFLTNNNNALALWDGTTQWTANTGIPANKWTHVAVTRSGTSINFYIDGVLDRTLASFTTNFTGSGVTYIGGNGQSSDRFFVGSISNLRVVNGVAVYTGNYTVPSSPLATTQSSSTNIAAITGTRTVLLACRNLSGATFSDSSSNTFVITATNGPVNQNIPVGTGVVLERGLGGVGGNNASYIIVWDGQNNQLNFAASNANGNNYSVGSLTGSTGNIGNPTINAWNHIAVSHTGTTYRGFLNGNLNFTITNNANVPYAALGRGVTIGGMFNAGQTYATGIPSNTISGYISNMRIIRGNSIYNAAFTPSTTAQLGNVTNTILLTGLTPAFEDLSGVHTLATNGQNQISISTINPITPNSVISANGANVSLNIKTLGSRRTRIYNKLNYSNFNKSIPIFNAMGKRQTRIYNKLNYLNFTSSVPVFNTIGNEQSRIYNKLDYSNFNKSVPIFNTMGKRQTRIYSKSDYSKFAYIPMGQVPSNQYEFWS